MVYIQTPQGKDFNEDLMVFRGKMEQEEKNSKEIQGMIQECECLQKQHKEVPEKQFLEQKIIDKKHGYRMKSIVTVEIVRINV